MKMIVNQHISWILMIDSGVGQMKCLKNNLEGAIL